MFVELFRLIFTTRLKSVEGNMHVGVADKTGTQILRERPALLMTTAFTILWLAIDGFFVPPDFGGMDIYSFKDAGINLAEGIGFVTRTSFGNPSFEYRPFVLYPPLYPLLFGMFMKLFGVSALMNQLFNSLISTVLGILGFLALKPLFSGRASSFELFWLAIGFAISVCTGFYLPIADRPDGLGIGFGVLAVLILNQSNSRRNEFIAGSLCAFALGASPFAGILTSVLVGCIVIARHYSSGGFRLVVSRLIIVGSSALLMLSVSAILLGILLPDWFYGFSRTVTGSATQSNTAGAFFIALLRGDVRTWLSGFQFHIYYVALIKLLVVQCALIGSVIVDRIRSGVGWQGQPIVALLALSPLSMIVAPYQVHYLPMTAALLIVAAASITLNMLPASRQYYAAAILTGFALMSILSFPYVIRKLILRSGTRPSMERAIAFMDGNRTRFNDPQRFLSVSPTTYILWRQMGLRPVEATAFFTFDDAENRKKLAYVALAYPGSSDPLTPMRPPVWIAEYRLEHQPELPQVPTVLGWPVSSSSWTWESAFYVRRDETKQ